MATIEDLTSPEALQGMGLVLPGPGYIAGAILFGLIGWVAFRRGRKAQRPVLTWLGVALMAYPYAVPQTWLMWAVGTALTVWLCLKWE